MNTVKDAENRLKSLGIGDMPVLEIKAVPRVLPKDWFAKFRAARREFLAKKITNNKEEMFMMDLSVNDIMAMLYSEKIADNASIKFKIPPIFGGDISADNMYMCRTNLEGRAIDIFNIEQAGNSVIYIPNPAKFVYVTSLGTLGAPQGGNSTSDRLSEVQSVDVINSVGGRE